MSAFDAGGIDTAGATVTSGGKGIASTSGSLLDRLAKAAVFGLEFGGLRFSSGAGSTTGAGSTSEATALMPTLAGKVALALAGGLGFCWMGGLGCSVAGLCGGACEPPELNTRVCRGPNLCDSG